MPLKNIRFALLFLFGLLILASCGGKTQATAQQAPVSIPQKIIVVQQQTVTPPSASANFAKWVADFKQEALAKGISQDLLDRAFANVSAPSDDVMKHDKAQPEKTRLFRNYIKGFITDKKLDAAREQWASHADMLKEVSKTYNVPVPILLALWHTESRFGENQGNFSIIQSLSTLAYDGRRSAFFREQLLDAFMILQQEHMDPAALTGSWAGAMGQVQFMPSSFLAFAVDFDGDGRKDIWTDDADAAASMANYLHTRGWNNRIGWGFHVRIPEGVPTDSWVQSKEQLTLTQWRKRGLRNMNRNKTLLRQGSEKMRLVMPDGDPDTAYLVTSNYDVIMDWNRSIYFATAVNLLADAIGEGEP